MKQILLLAAIVTISVNAFSQNRNSFRHYISPAYQNLIIHEYTDDSGNEIKDESVEVCSTLTGIVKLGSDGYPEIDFFSIITKPYADRPECINSTSRLGKFKFDLKRSSLGEPTRVIHIPFTAVTYGVGTTAVRFRGKDNNGQAVISGGLSATFNTGFTAGWSSISHRKINNYSATIGPFLGIATADITESTAVNKENWVDKKQTNATIAYGGNVILAANNFGIVFSLGFDEALGSDRKEWIFNSKPWFGIGISTSLGYF